MHVNIEILINNYSIIDRVINQNACEYRNFTLYGLLFFIKVCWNCFVPSIISSHVFTELSIILAKYSPFSQLHVSGFQI